MDQDEVSAVAKPPKDNSPITEHLAYLLAQANREINRQLELRLSKEGVPVEQWRILKVLSDGDGHSMGELADAQESPLRPLLAAARLQQQRAALNERYIARLRDELPLQQIYLPYLFTPEFGAEAVAELSRRLEGQVGPVGHIDML